jgi:hypothetical protein
VLERVHTRKNREVTKYVRFEHRGTVNCGIWEDDVFRELDERRTERGAARESGWALSTESRSFAEYLSEPGD